MHACNISLAAQFSTVLILFYMFTNFRIVHDREQTSSFQLICITHDHEFLDIMAEWDFFSHYWEVSRDHR